MAFNLIYNPQDGKTYYGDPTSGQVYDPSTGQWGDDPFGGGQMPDVPPGVVLIPDPNLGWRQLLPGELIQRPGGPSGYEWYDPSTGNWWNNQGRQGAPLPGNFGQQIPEPPASGPSSTPPSGTQPPTATPPTRTPPPGIPPGGGRAGTSPGSTTTPPASGPGQDNRPWWQQLIAPGFGALASSLGFGGESGSERRLREAATAPFGSNLVQGFLPGPLRAGTTDPIIQAAMRQIGQLVAQPGRLAPGVSEAILPRLAAESENIATQFRGLRSQQEGAAARGNVPVSIKSALSSALDVSQERAQRAARREALTDSDLLARQDINQVYPLLNSLLQFSSSGRGQAIPGLAQSANLAQTRNASNLGAIGSLLTALGTIDWNK